MRSRFISVLFLALVGVVTTISRAQPFTYQGHLTEGTLPADGLYQMEFSLFNDPTTGSSLATTPIYTVRVTNGLFTAIPEFAGNLITNSNFYIQVAVRPLGAVTPLTPVLPRQRITPAPLATRSLSDQWTALSPTTIRTNPGVTNLLVNATTPLFPDTFLTLSGAVGTFGFSGMYVNTTSPTGTAYYGLSVNNVSRVEARYNGANSTFSLFLSNVQRLSMTPAGNVGLGTDPGSERLRIFGNTTTTGIMQADAFNYGTRKNRSVIIPAEAFKPSSSGLTGVFGPPTGLAFLDSSVLSGNIVAVVPLPHGAEVVGMDVSFIDNSPSNDLSISLYRRGFAATSYSILGSVATSGSSASIQTLSEDSIVLNSIDTDAFSYFIFAFCSDWQGNLTAIKSVRIRYTVGNPD